MSEPVSEARENPWAFCLKLSAIQFFLIFACAFFNFTALTNWDGEWYRQIVDIGYNSVHSADVFAEGHGNVGFFPGYPLAAYCVKKVLGFGTDIIPTTAALLITSFGFTILTWFFLLKWLELFRAARPKVNLIFLALYPFSFIFYCAYTESLFTSMLLGFVYFSEQMIRSDDRKKAMRNFGLALFFGFTMNLTRIPGIVMVAYPIIRCLQAREKMKRSLMLAGGALTSPILFFLYCDWKFGAWDFYFKTERAIWGTYIDLGKLFPPKTLFDFRRPTYSNTVGKYVGILLGVFLCTKLVQLLRKGEGSSPAFAVVLVGGMMWGEYMIARTSWDFVGLGRYLIPVMALALPFVGISPRWNWKWMAVGSVFLGFQIAYALKFGRHGWVV